MAIQRCGSQDYCPETIRCTWGVVDSVFSAGAPPVWLRYERVVLRTLTRSGVPHFKLRECGMLRSQPTDRRL